MSKDLKRGIVLLVAGVIGVAVIEKLQLPIGNSSLAQSGGTFFTSLLTAIGV